MLKTVDFERKNYQCSLLKFDEETRLFIAGCQAPTPKYPVLKEIVWKIDIYTNMQVKAF
jgi:hypothetical protein